MHIASQENLRAILHRLSVPTMLFSGALVVALTISRTVILPVMTRVEVNGVTQSVESLKVRAEELTAKITALEATRTTTLVPLQGTTYGDLASEKLSAPSLPAVLTSLSDTIRSVEADAPGSILISQISFDPLTRHLELSGDVQKVGPRSMTVLAQLTESFRANALIASVSTPAFQRVEDPLIGAHSPFHLTLELR